MGKILKVFGNCLRAYLLLGKMLIPIWSFSKLLGAFQYDKWANIEKIIQASGHIAQDIHMLTN